MGKSENNNQPSRGTSALAVVLFGLIGVALVPVIFAWVFSDTWNFIAHLFGG